MAMDPLTWLSLIGSTPTPPPTGAFPPAMAPQFGSTPGGAATGFVRKPPLAVPQGAPQLPVPSQDISAFPTLGASLAGAQFQNPATVAGSVGGNVAAAPVPIPRARPGEAPQANRTSLEGGGGGGGGQGGGGTEDRLRDALRGVSAPKPPEAQYVRTPPPPQIAPIRGGEFLQLLTSLGIGPQEFMRLRTGGR